MAPFHESSVEHDAVAGILVENGRFESCGGWHAIVKNSAGSVGGNSIAQLLESRYYWIGRFATKKEVVTVTAVYFGLGKVGTVTMDVQ